MSESEQSRPKSNLRSNRNEQEVASRMRSLCAGICDDFCRCSDRSWVDSAGRHSCASGECRGCEGQGDFNVVPTTSYAYITLGLGITLNCVGATNNPRKFDSTQPWANIAPNGHITWSNVGWDITIGGFANWAIAEPHQCTVDYRVRAAGGVSPAGSSGTGYDFILTGNGLEQVSDTTSKVFNMRRTSGGGCQD